MILDFIKNEENDVVSKMIIMAKNYFEPLRGKKVRVCIKVYIYILYYLIISINIILFVLFFWEKKSRK